MLIYDIEIEKAILGKGETPKTGINYCGGFNDFANMGIACVGVYDFNIGRTRVFLKDNLAEFEKIFCASDCNVGFNNHRFDNRLLIANGLSFPVGKSYDILEEVWRGLGLSMTFRPETHGGLSLDNFAYANFRITKNGKGATAPIDWQEGRRGKVIDYCLSDVEITRRLLQRIVNKGSLKHPKTGEEIKIRKPSPEV
jgi:hypothetical protein